jgi:methionyl-tRNA formyltransferase
VLRKHPGRFFDKVALHLFRKLTRDDVCHKAALADVLGDMSKGFSHTSLVSRVGRPRNGQLENAVRKQDPDILAIYGTGLIPETVLRYARTLAINMHTGLSPYYRGTACAFWPLHENEPEKLGATVHECTSEIDGGQIFSCARSSLIAGDTLHHAFARAVVAGTEIYLNVLRKAQNDAVLGIPQDLRKGREYQ